MASDCCVKVDVSEIMPLIEYMRRITIRINRRWWVAYLERRARFTVRLTNDEEKAKTRHHRKDLAHNESGYCPRCGECPRDGYYVVFGFNECPESQLEPWGHG